MKAVLFLLIIASASHADDKPWGARLKLVSEQAAIAPGRPFEVGIRIHHREGFHSYWKNPGPVGFATRVEWKLPVGFTAGPLAWPPPELVDMAGNACHGYHRDVMLTATITPPSTIDEEEITLAARIAWMACADACHPGDGKFSITLPVGDTPKSDPGTAELFAKAHAEQPRPLPGWKAELLSETDAPGIVLRLTATAEHRPALVDPYFFSSDGQVADGKPAVAAHEPGVMILTFKRAEFGPKGATGLPGLIQHGPPGARVFGSIAP